MKTIYLAEDDIVTRTLVAEQIKDFGYAVVTFEDGMSAHDALMANPHGADLLVTDVRMPGMDGLSLIRKLRGHGEFTSLPIIIMSGVVGVRDISDLLRNGASRFLAKPVDISDLEETIRKALSLPHIR